MPEIPITVKNQLAFSSLAFPRAETIKAIRNDELANLHAPQVIAGSKHRDPSRLLYRAAVDSEGNTYIAYHFVWDTQKNDGPGFMPFLCRQIYSNKKRLHGLVFGKSDVEMVVLKIDKSGQAEKIAYSTAENYNPRAMKVKHKFIEEPLEQNAKGCLEIVSWNHLFDRQPDSRCSESTVGLKAEYFTPDLWKEFRMIKSKKLFFRQHRDFATFELQAVTDQKPPT